MNRLLILLLFTFVVLLVDYYAFQAIKTLIIGFSSASQRAIKLVYFSFTALVILAIFVYNFGDPDSLARHARTFIMSFIFINVLGKLILALFVFIDDIVRGVRWAIMKFSSTTSNELGGEPISRSKFIATTGIIVAAAPIISMSWGIISGAHDYRIRRLKLPVKALSPKLQGFKIVQLSDIHSGSFWNKTAVKGGIEMIVEQKADLILFTGDLVNNKATEMEEWAELFSKINAPYGVYSVLGNHDYGDYVRWNTSEEKSANLEQLLATQNYMGWEVLRNEHRSIDVDGERIGLVGVENWSAKERFPKYGDLDLATKELPKDTSVNILMSHDPSHWREEVITKYPNMNLTLSGHTHGMQFGVEIPGFKWSPVQYMYKEWAGLYQSEEQYLYVNRGFGYIGYPGRFGILPEITVIELENKA
ncbi:MAG: metallophosphatase [Verrucomicrobia bacterium]|nr:metallophosphatase [Verrucomicrobiota bacterium]